MKSETSFIPPAADPAWRVAIIHSSYYPEEVGALVASAKDALLRSGIPEKNISLHAVHGSFEIPLIGSVIAETKKADAMIGIGIIVEGETEHARLIAESAAQGMMEIQVQHGIPFAFEVLHVRSLADAKARADKGAEAAVAVLRSLSEKARVKGHL